jgi:hypothetical protein
MTENDQLIKNKKVYSIPSIWDNKINFIVRNYHKFKKYQMKFELDELIKIIKDHSLSEKKTEIIKKNKTKNIIDKEDQISKKEEKNADKEIATYESEFNKRFCENNETFNEAFDKVIRRSVPVYDKIMGIIRVCRKFGGWHHIRIIPDKYLIDFINMADEISDIKMDGDRGYQYFKVM